ncbi:MAG: hypothetical protein AVDCRST_MAG88-4012, partial [uncultured Thermomicrobiales bacterium]
SWGTTSSCAPCARMCKATRTRPIGSSGTSASA